MDGAFISLSVCVGLTQHLSFIHRTSWTVRLLLPGQSSLSWTEGACGTLTTFCCCCLVLLQVLTSRVEVAFPRTHLWVFGGQFLLGPAESLSWENHSVTQTGKLVQQLLGTRCKDHVITAQRRRGGGSVTQKTISSRSIIYNWRRLSILSVCFQVFNTQTVNFTIWISDYINTVKTQAAFIY